MNLSHMNPCWAHLSLLGRYRSGEARFLLLQSGTVCREDDHVRKERAVCKVGGTYV